MGFLWDFYKKIYGVRKKASPFREGGTAERRASTPERGALGFA